VSGHEKEGLEADGSRHLNYRPRHWFRGGFRAAEASEQRISGSGYSLFLGYLLNFHDYEIAASSGILLLNPFQ
jgi:hypothetical protein